MVPWTEFNRLQASEKPEDAGIEVEKPEEPAPVDLSSEGPKEPTSPKQGVESMSQTMSASVDYDM